MESNYFVFNDVSNPNENRRSTVEILRVGKWVYGGKEIEFTEDILKQIAKNFKEGIRPKPPTELVVDYNHGSMEVEPEKSKAAGWVKDLYFKDGSLYAVIKWTPKAVQYLKEEEFRYVSAEVSFDYKSKENGESVGAALLAVALTNRPFIEGQESISLSDREELRKKAEARAKKYGIHVRDDGHLTIPSEYSDCPEKDFADPVNYRYPCNTEERAMAAYKYFSKEKNRSFYSPEEQAIIEKRIKAHLPKDIKKNAFKGGEMSEDVKLTEQITKLTEENGKLKEEIVSLKEENEKLKKGLLLSEANDWVNTKLNEKYILAKEKDMFIEMYLKDKDFAKKFVETRGKVLPEGVDGEDTDESVLTLDEVEKIRKYAKENNISFAEAFIKVGGK